MNSPKPIRRPKPSAWSRTGYFSRVSCPQSPVRFCRRVLQKGYEGVQDQTAAQTVTSAANSYPQVRDQPQTIVRLLSHQGSLCRSSCHSLVQVLFESAMSELFACPPLCLVFHAISPLRPRGPHVRFQTIGTNSWSIQIVRAAAAV